MPILISPMSEIDSSDVAKLSGQLGYATNSESVIRNLKVIRTSSAQEIFIARVSDSVAGWLHVYEHLSISTGVRCEIGGLVVDEEWRGKGIGTSLMNAAEDWAKSRGLLEIRFSSRVTRVEAHRLYERLGYGIQKTSHIFSKTLP